MYDESKAKNGKKGNAMKKILLIGDSIRMGYDAYVRESMQALAEVYYPKANCGSSYTVLRSLHSWTDELGLYEADAVHFNVGHWDTVRIYKDEPITSLAVYQENVRRIAKRIRFLFPTAQILFATSTPVREEGFIEDFEMRFNRDVDRYNLAACEALEELGVTVNDLHACIKDCPSEWFSDQTHLYTAEATECLGGQVCRLLCERLALDPSLLLRPDAEKFHRPMAYPMDREAYERRGHIYVEKKKHG